MSREKFHQWIEQHCDGGERLIAGEIDWGPAEYIRHPQGSLATFYERIGRWDTWLVTLQTNLRSTVRHPEALLEMTRGLHSDGALLRYSIRLNTGAEGPIDLSNRALYTGRNADGLRSLTNYYGPARGEDIPTWAERRQAMLDRLRLFRRTIAEQIPTLEILGEIQDPRLEAALLGLTRRTYIDIATVRAHLANAEPDMRAQRWNPGGAELRNALERILMNSNAEMLRRTPAATAPNLRAICDALGRPGPAGVPGFVREGIAKYAYGTFSLLSDLCSHPGLVAAEDGARAWHAAVVAISLLSDHLPA